MAFTCGILFIGLMKGVYTGISICNPLHRLDERGYIVISAWNPLHCIDQRDSH